MEDKRGFVYVAKDSARPGHLKIGRTKDLAQREATLQGGAMVPTIKIIQSALVDDMFAAEHAFHETLKRQRTAGEWFNIEHDQVSAMLTYLDKRLKLRAPPSEHMTQSAAKSRRGSWHEDGWKMHCEGASEAAIAKQFGVKPGTVASMKRKMRDAGRGYEERDRSGLKRSTSQVSKNPTPKGAFRKPIVDVLRGLGGRGKAGEVLRGVEKKVDLTEADLKLRKNGGVVWANNASWERDQMVKEGVLKPTRDSGHGWWELA